MSITDRVRIEETTVLSDQWAVLTKTRFAFRRSDGEWQEQVRESYDRGNGATILLYDRARRTIVLTRQFRYPAYVNGYDDLLIETPAGLLDAMEPEARIRAETEEETGYRIGRIEKVFEAFMSPGSVTERLFFFIGEYRPSDRTSPGGGHAGGGEDIETLEVTIDEALAMIADGRIIDAKTIILIQHAALHIFRD
jgi:nudix-type nucleoside diphosphatase (YffH/AdpP family)